MVTLETDQYKNNNPSLSVNSVFLILILEFKTKSILNSIFIFLHSIWSNREDFEF